MMKSPNWLSKILKEETVTSTISNRRKRAAWEFMGIRIWQESDIQHCILSPNNRPRQSVHFIYGGSFCHSYRIGPLRPCRLPANKMAQ